MLSRRALAPTLALLGAAGCAGERAGDDTPPPPPAGLILPVQPALELREDALSRVRVWRQPEVPVGETDLFANPDGPAAFRRTDELTCRFVLKSSEGRTPKFQCALPGGEVVKVKYGRSNREPRAEVAGSRLALALGFGADAMSVVRRVRCYGCPRYPYPRLPWLDSLLAGLSRHTSFDYPALERTFEGTEIRTAEREGWSWEELDRVDPARGGAGRAELDGFRLFAVFLNHWDNKAENQRLVCLPGGQQPDGSCTRPFALIHDFGATFGPRGADLEGWTTHPIWDDPRTCAVSLRDLPFQGATFAERRISEDGRRFLAGLLSQLRPAQVRDLFRGARLTDPGASPDGDDVDGWVRAFQDRVRQIVDRPPCSS